MDGEQRKTLTPAEVEQKLASIIGSAALEGLKTPPADEADLRALLSGEADFDEVKAQILRRYGVGK